MLRTGAGFSPSVPVLRFPLCAALFCPQPAVPASTAAASQQVTATTQELVAHMNEVENDITGLAAGSHELAARLNTFEV